MFSPIVQEKKGCLTTLAGKKQKEVVKCFGSQSLELCVFLTESARTEKCWSQASLAPRPPVRPQQTRWETHYSCGVEKSASVNISQHPPFL